jgi:hypothetical protein
VGKELLTGKLKGILSLRAEVREGPGESGLPNEGRLHQYLTSDSKTITQETKVCTLSNGSGPTTGLCMKML